MFKNIHLPYLFVVCVFCISCKSRQYAGHTSKMALHPLHAHYISKKYASFDDQVIAYITRYKSIAVIEMQAHGIPASITLAQGIHESAAGQSILATEANNHFGIKCTGDWGGPSFKMDDDKPNECFRKYDNAEASFTDHTLFLSRKRYATLFLLKKTDYKGWARTLKQTGYATNPHYAEILTGLIEKYNLTQFDTIGINPPMAYSPAVLNEPLADEKPVRADTQVLDDHPDLLKKYTVKQGDTVYSLARRFHLTVDQFKTLNGLKGNDLKIDQIVTVAF